ncbi:hypothetical protein DRO58_04500 [Candidatus Bathyarchaeota archaeon]|nr:MAG: hypothetical protein DRO58_04500 [Candidatus Bathyarchaeota archaeon]
MFSGLSERKPEEVASGEREESLVFRIYPFNALREYVVGLLLIVLGFRLMLFTALRATSFEVAVTVALILVIVAVWRIRSIKLTAVDVVRVTLVVVIILSPILASKFIEFYNPPDYLTFAWDGVVEGFTMLRSNPTYLTVAMTLVFSLAAASIAYAVTMTWRFKIVLTEDAITVERLFPMKKSYKIPIKSIVSVEVVQSSIGKRLDYGNLILVTDPLGTILIPKIERPMELRNLIIERYAKTTGRPEPIPGSENYTVDDAPTKSVTLKPDVSCPICMNSILTSASSEVFLSVCPFCSSVFHTSCLLRWMKKSGYKCPVCGKHLSPPLGD